MPTRLSKAERTEKTQRALLDAARGLFTEKGYADTSTEEVVRRAGVTRGALYYHYHDKAKLFEAVFREVRGAYMQAIIDRVQMAEGDIWQRTIVTGCQAFIESAKDPTVQRIIHVDGPAILDWPAMQQNAPGVMLLRNVFAQLMDDGVIEKLPIDPLIHLLWAAFFEAGTYIGQADDSDVAEAEVATALLRIISGLRS